MVQWPTRRAGSDASGTCLRPVAVDNLGTGPSFGRGQHDHGPPRPRRSAGKPCIVLDVPDALDCRVERGRHRFVHRGRLVALDEIRQPAVALQQLLQLFARDARKERRVGDLVAIQMQDRQHRAVGRRIEKLVGMPRGGQRSGLRFAVADDARDDEIGVVEHRAERVAQRIAELATLVNRSGALGRHMARNAAGE